MYYLQGRNGRYLLDNQFQTLSTAYVRVSVLQNLHIRRSWRSYRGRRDAKERCVYMARVMHIGLTADKYHELSCLSALSC